MTASRRAVVVLAVFVVVAFGLPWSGAVPAASAQTIQVTSADPPSGEQGTLNLNVLIKGKGFKNGAKAKFYKTGTTDPAGVNVKSTQYVSSTQLVANIDIDEAAALALFDIEVKNTDGRTGKGTELFSVLAKKVSACTEPDPVPMTEGVHLSPPEPQLPGYLDFTFGNAGRAIGPRHIVLAGQVVPGGPLAIDSVGRIVFVGYRSDTCATNSQPEGAIVRYLPNGSPDLEFGLDGVVRMAIGVGGGSLKSVVVQADDKIVVAGAAQPTKSSSTQAMVVRLNVNGSLDTTFGSGGIAWVSPFGNRVTGSLGSVTLQSNGKIVAAGYVYSGSVKLVSRLNTNGTLDATFNGSGYYLWNADGAFRSVTTQRVGSDERIVVAGYVPDTLRHSIGTIWRFTGAGALDASFGGTGVVETSFHVEDGRQFEDGFSDVAVDSSNRIVAAGHMGVWLTPEVTSFQSQVALARYDVYGNLDTSFGVEGTGKAWAPTVHGDDTITALAIHADGGILVAGYSHSIGLADGHVGVLWRFNTQGAVDMTFGDGGWVQDPVASGARLVYWLGMALQADGGIICGGTIAMEGTPQISYPVLARFWQ